MIGWTVILVKLHLLLSLAESVRNYDQIEDDLCAIKVSCEACVQTTGCVWCSKVLEKSDDSSMVRCASRERFQAEKDLWCKESYVVDEQNHMELLKNESLSSIKGKEPVQIQPQRMRLRLRIGEEQRVTVKYSQAEDYPVDLYYLMDLSASMESYKNDLSKLGLRLSEAMGNLTENFRLGFGSFVDKVVLPMTSTQPDKLRSPCKLKNGKACAPPYSYQNQMSLTEKLEIFKSRVEKAPISGNLDSPEGGLDALMQVMVCTDAIGWREKARHLIVFSTDASFHIAGDGRLAGIIEPNDCQCHLDEQGYYIYSLLQDYPSISQINRKALENNMNIIFAVTSDKHATYQTLSSAISGSSVGSIVNDSRNVVQLITDEYEKLVNEVSMTDNAPSMIDVRYTSRCLSKTDEPMERKECGGLRLGSVVEFHVDLKLTECPKNQSEWQQRIEIKPSGVNESLAIEINLICGCNCERATLGNESTSNATECRGNGRLTCGICRCNEGFYGKHCECKRSMNIVGSSMDECKRHKNSSEVCSGHGVCKCGVCDCLKRPNPQEVFYGKYCECDNFSCSRSDGKVCGGRGRCECGNRCNCMAGWTGEACDCRETNATCINSKSNGHSEICSGRGQCICGNCHCHEINNVRYSGQYCEGCPTCPEERCAELKDCVECVAYDAGPLSKKPGKCSECPHQIDIVESIDEDLEEIASARVCRSPGDNGCTFLFRYEYHRGGTSGDMKLYEIKAQKERICSKSVDVLGVALGVVTSTVILGFLILLAWKIVTNIHDRREYMRFEKERATAKWDRADNPLYKQATTTFSNPTFDANK
ncbi:integrin beta-PS-like [Prorops nasuta]|uniref:integrin beta-PS-like n=1 Tax=Prorops nasuta TaxID=863751 RepID=UPI0034CF4232